MRTRLLVVPLLALLGASIAPAHALRYAVAAKAGQDTVSVGMTSSEVLALLGPPSTSARFGSGRGPTWSYPVNGATPGTRAFYVEFGPDNRVISAQEYSTPAGG
jgi:outer membrane protein assembly factor BamE (lipoprotein component of BamABCDE complex)